MALLGFIPGIGDAVIIGRAVEIIESISDVAKAARLSRLLDEDSALGRLFASQSPLLPSHSEVAVI